MYRQFQIKNSIGETFDLNGTKSLFATPGGLGYQQDNNLASIGDGFYVNVKKTWPKISVTGMVVFGGDDPYVDYVEFVDFINKGYDLTMAYTPRSVTYYSEIDIEYVNKGELNEIGILEIPISIARKTPWYKITPQMVDIIPGSGGNVSTYDLTYDYEFIGESTGGETPVISLGHIPASLEIVVPGALTNPSITLTDSNGNIIGKMQLTGNVPLGSNLIYSSKYLSPGVWIDDVEQIDNLNINNENFFRVPTGETCSLTVASEGVVNLAATVNLYDYYRSV